MSYGIVRVQKFTSGSVKGIEIHDKREKEHSRTNPDIDFERSEQNYDLCLAHHENFYKAIKERISELDLKKVVRKDAIVMAQVLVTSDSEFFKNLTMMSMESYSNATHRAYASDIPFTRSSIDKTSWTDYTREFFKDAYEFLAERYGRENVISATVHLDEKTPHMHFNFVPITKDGRLSAKDVFSRKNLIEQQTAFYEKVGKKYDLLRGEPKEAGKERAHLNTAEYKSKTQQLNEINQKIEKAQNKLEVIEQAIEDKETQQNALEGKFEALNATIQEKENKIQTLQKTVDDLETQKSEIIEQVKSLIDYGKEISSTEDWLEIAREIEKTKKLESKSIVLDNLIEKLPEIQPIVQRLMRQEHLNRIVRDVMKKDREKAKQQVREQNRFKKSIDRER